MGYDSGVPQRKNMAAGDGQMSGGDFGCCKIESGPSMAPVSEMTKGHVADGDKRGAGMPVKHTRGKFPSQSEVDHGPHGISKAMA
jgi:hypothetical protein